MKILGLILVILALFHAAQGKKCCNHDCTQVISQGRSFREYTATEHDALPLERDAKIWVFMKEMGVNEEGEEMWFGESRGKRGYFPKHLIGEYMVLCRDLVEIHDWDDEANEEVVGEENREDVQQSPPDSLDAPSDELDIEERYENEPDNETTSQDKGVPEMVNLWRIKETQSEPNIAEFHAPDTDAMQALKKQMDQDFLNRILEAEGVERIDEIDSERISEFLQDPIAARIVLEALEELRLSDVTTDVHGDIVRSWEGAGSREISPPEVDTPVDGDSDGNLPDTDDTYREISPPEVDIPVDGDSDGNLPDTDDANRESSHPETTDFSSEDNYPNEHTDSLDISEVSDIVDKDSYDENREISHPELTDDFEDIPMEHDREVSHLDETVIPQPSDTDQENEPSSEEAPREISHPDVSTLSDKIYGIIPSPLSDIIRGYIHTYGIFYITIYTLIPLVITHLYVSRRTARNQVNTHKIKTASHVKTLEQKVASLQKEKKAIEAKIAKYDTLKEVNAASQEEVNSLRANFENSQQELAGCSQCISRLESEAAQLTTDIQTLQENLNERYAHVSRLETLNDSAQEEILSLNGKIDLANVDIRQAGTEKMTLQLRLDANIDSFTELKEKLKEVEKSRDDVEKKKSRLQDDLKQKEAINSANSDCIHTLEGEIEVLTNSLLKLQPKEMGSLTATDTQKKNIFETLTNTAKALSELEQVTVSRDRFERESRQFSTENIALKAHSEDLEDNLSCVKSNNILLKKQLGDSDTKLQVLNEYFNTKESDLHRQLNESRNNQILLEGKDHRSLEEIDSVRSERGALKSEILVVKQQHSQREKSLLEQIASLEKRVQDSLYSSRRSEQELRGRDRDITDLKRKLGESSLPTSQPDTYLSPRSTSPSSQLSSNSDTEARGEKNRGTQSPSQAQFASTGPPLPNFTSGPPTRIDPPATVTTHAKPNPIPGYMPGYMPPNFYRPAPYPPMMGPFPPRPIIPQNMHHFNSPTVPKHRPRQAVPTDEQTETVSILNKPPPGLYVPSPPTLIDSLPSNEYAHPEEHKPDSSQEYNGSLLDSQTHATTPPQKEASAFLIDV